MFKKSVDKPQQDPVLKLGELIGAKKRAVLTKETAWHNLFFQTIVSQIDETPYAVLYHDEIGRSNVSIKELVGMLILKDGHRWTDEKMFENCNFNLLVMKALGFQDINDECPVASTYYDFKVKLLEYYITTGVDLIVNTFRQLAQGQVLKYKISGKTVRTDSKLISSNIATCTRLQLVIETIQHFYHHLDKAEKASLSPTDIGWLEVLDGSPAASLTYKMSNTDKKELIVGLGIKLHELIQEGNNKTKDSYALIVRLFNEQYEFVEEKKTNIMRIRLKLVCELVRK